MTAASTVAAATGFSVAATGVVAGAIWAEETAADSSRVVKLAREVKGRGSVVIGSKSGITDKDGGGRTITGGGRKPSLRRVLLSPRAEQSRIPQHPNSHWLLDNRSVQPATSSRDMWWSQSENTLVASEQAGRRGLGTAVAKVGLRREYLPMKRGGKSGAITQHPAGRGRRTSIGHVIVATKSGSEIMTGLPVDSHCQITTAFSSARPDPS